MPVELKMEIYCFGRWKNASIDYNNNDICAKHITYPFLCTIAHVFFLEFHPINYMPFQGPLQRKKNLNNEA